MRPPNVSASATARHRAGRPASARRRTPPSARAVIRPWSVPRLLPHLVGLDHVLDLDVAVADADAALVALADLGHVLLEPAQRVHAEVLRHHDAVADQACLAAAGDDARTDDAAGHVADARHPEDLADLRRSELCLLELGLEQALERGLDLVDRLVDDRVVADVHALALGQLPGPAGRPHVEADDHRIRGDGQVDVVLGDRADAAADDPQDHVLAHIDLEQRVLEGLDGPGHVALDDEQQFLALAGLQRGLQILQRDPRPALGEQGGALTGFPPLGDLPRHPLVGHDQEVVTGVGHRVEPEYLHRARRRRVRDRGTVLVEQRPDPAERLATDDRGADLQRAALDQHGRHRAAALVQVRLDRDALRVLVRVGPQVQLRVGGQDDRLQQGLDAGALPGRDVHEQGGAAELLGHQAVLGELGAHPGRVRPLLVDLVDRHHDRHRRRLGVVERLGGLWLDAVVRRHHQDHQVGGLGAAGPHGGEGLVTRGVDEGDLAVRPVHLGRDLVGADVLGDAARLPGHHVGVPDGVEQLGLAVVDMAHDRHHRRPRLQVSALALVLTELDVEGLQQLPVLLLGGDDLDVVVELGAEQMQGLVVHRLGGGHHLAEVEEHLDERGRVHPDLVGEVTQRRAPGQPDDLAVPARDLHPADRGRLHVVELLAPLLARLAAARGTPAGTPDRALGAAATAPAAGTAAATTNTGTGATAGAPSGAGTGAHTGTATGSARAGAGARAAGTATAGAAGAATAGAA